MKEKIIDRMDEEAFGEERRKNRKKIDDGKD